MRTPYRTVKGNHPGGGVPQEEYDALLEKYNQKSILVNGISIAPFLVSGGDGSSSPTRTLATISFTQDGVDYGCIAYSAYHSGDRYDNAAISGSKKTANSDFTHVSNYVSTGANREAAYIKDGRVWTNGSSILIDFTLPHRYESNYKYRRGIWNYKGNNSITFSEIAADTAIPSGYSPITKNERIKNVTIKENSQQPYSTFYVTLTLK